MTINHIDNARMNTATNNRSIFNQSILNRFFSQQEQVELHLLTFVSPAYEECKAEIIRWYLTQYTRRRKNWSGIRKLRSLAENSKNEEAQLAARTRLEALKKEGERMDDEEKIESERRIDMLRRELNKYFHERWAARNKAAEESDASEHIRPQIWRYFTSEEIKELCLESFVNEAYEKQKNVVFKECRAIFEELDRKEKVLDKLYQYTMKDNISISERARTLKRQHESIRDWMWIAWRQTNYEMISYLREELKRHREQQKESVAEEGR